MLVLALCLLWAPALSAGPMDAGFPPEPAACGAPGPLCAPADTAESLGSALEYADREVLSGSFSESDLPSQPDLAAVAPAEKTPSSWTLLIIGGAMIWLAGIFRYRPGR